MDAWDFRVFEAVAKEGGMTKAADVLHTVQSNVTKRIRQLETELGTALFHRHKNGISLTTAGEQLLPYAEKIRQLLAEAKGAVTNALPPRGPLRIGAIETTVALRLAPLFMRFGKSYPDVDLSVETDTSGALIAEVLEYRLEGAFVAGPVTHPHLLSMPVCEEEMVLYTPSDTGDIIKFLKARSPKVLVFRGGCSYREKLERLFVKWGLTQIRFLEFSSLDGIFGCVSAGLGVTLFPRALSEQPLWKLRWGKSISVHRLRKTDAMAPTLFVRRRDAFVSAAMARLIDLIPSVNHRNGKA